MESSDQNRTGAEKAPTHESRWFHHQNGDLTYPCIPANIITPLMSINILRVHEISKVEESVPTALLDLILVELGKELEIAFDLCSNIARSVCERRGPPCAGRLRFVDVFGLRVQDGRVVGVLYQGR